MTVLIAAGYGTGEDMGTGLGDDDEEEQTEEEHGGRASRRGEASVLSELTIRGLEKLAQTWTL